MNFFKDEHMTRGAQRVDQIMAAQDEYWDAQANEYRHSDQDTPGKALIVHYLPPSEVQIEVVVSSTEDTETSYTLEVA